jgi:hypothetical protein
MKTLAMQGFFAVHRTVSAERYEMYDKVRLLLKASKLIVLFLEKLPIHKIYGRKECAGLHARAHDYFTS